MELKFSIALGAIYFATLAACVPQNVHYNARELRSQMRTAIVIAQGYSCLATGSICDTGLVCAGTDTDRRCVKPMELGGDCGQDPFWICVSGLECIDGTCSSPVVTEGNSCLAAGSVCDTGLVCAGTDTDRRCVKPMELGGECGQDPFWICVDGLDCIDGTCRTPVVAEGDSCLAAGSVCDTGLVCAGTDTDRRCVKPMELGGECGQDPFWICVSGLECIDGTCRTPVVAEGDSCLAAGSVCDTGLVCAGTDTDRRCVKPMELGGECGQDPFWICVSGLECIDGTCRTPVVAEGDSCLAAGSVCDTGLVCAGTDTDRRCVKPMQLGGECGQDPFWICVDGLDCIDGTCRTPVVAEGDSCLAAGSVCDTGLVCAGTDTDRRCVKPMQLGGECGQDPFWICVDGLDCIDGTCRTPVVAEGDSCLAAGSVCDTGLVCAGTDTDRRCVKPMELGGECGQDPFWICVSGLECIDGTCRTPVVAEGDSCLAAGSVCDTGLVCAGTDTDRRCVKPMELGGECGQDPFWICVDGLDCNDGTCRTPVVAEGDSCLAAGSVCDTGLICAGTDTDRRCVKPMELGGECGQDPFWICVSGLECIDGTCRTPVVAEGDSCLAAGSVCDTGLICAGTDTDRRCVKPMQLGGECGQDPFWICVDGLDCIDGTCRTPVVAEGDSCLAAGSVCDTGLVCAGTDTDRRCVKPMELGGECGQDPFWICVSGLECIDGTCRTPVVAEGDSCLAAGSVCDTGLVCAGTDTDRRCVKPMELGGECGQDPFWICVDSLDCIDGTCRTPAIAEGESCLAAGSVCETGLVCAGTDTDRRCVKPMGSGGQCGQDPFWVCATGLQCVYGYCQEH